MHKLNLIAISHIHTHNTRRRHMATKAQRGKATKAYLLVDKAHVIRSLDDRLFRINDDVVDDRRNNHGVAAGIDHLHVGQI